MSSAPATQPSATAPQGGSHDAANRPARRRRGGIRQTRLQDLDAEARATFTDDKAVGLGRVAPAPGESPATIEQVPVLLLEPRTAMLMANPETGEVTEGQVDAIIKAGRQRLTWPAVLVEPAAGWTLQRTVDGIELRDAHGGPWVHCAVMPEPRWVSAAVSWGQVLPAHPCDTRAASFSGGLSG